MQRLHDSPILVTGSTRGIGFAIARRLIAEGAVVGVHGRDEARAQAVAEQLGGGAVGLGADLSDPAQGGLLVDRFEERCGAIFGLVNNAGGGEPSAFRGLTLERWRHTFAANAEAAMLTTQRAYRSMRKLKSGCVVNIASLAGHGPAGWMGADYGASKAALVSLTRSFAQEAARFGIRCNAVSPGFIDTDMTAELPQESRDALRIPLGNLGSSGDVAAAVAFLLSKDAQYMTGQVLHVDGGLFMHG